MSFKGQLQAFAAKSEKNLNDLTRKVMFDIGSRIVERTPVGDPSLWQNPAPPGYVGGRARGSWQYGFGTPSVDSVINIDPGGSATVNRIMAEVQPLPGLHYITSNLPYMPALEDGWSRQAPSGMVGLTVVEFSSIVDVAARGINK